MESDISLSCTSQFPSSDEKEARCQPFPQTEPLAEHLNQSFSGLRSSIGSDLLKHPVYSYVMTTAKVVGAEFRQTGCGPNFQGGLITLCTCKHKDRASPPKKGCRDLNPDDPWRGIWVLGLCSVAARRPRALFYLMLVDKTCGSHAAAWRTLDSPSAKSAHRDVFGDIYEPLSLPCAQEEWSESSYLPHLSAHVHNTKNRLKDIEKQYYGRHPRLLIGDPQHSYLWSQPTITLQDATDDGWSSAHHRFYPHLSDFLDLCQ